MDCHDWNITVAIPTKNEAKTIRDIIRGVKKYADEVIVVDGHSSDGTREIAENEDVRVVLDEGKGKGSGIRTAIREATGDIIVFIDADGSHDPDSIPKLIAPIVEGKADHVVGSRMRGGSDELHSTFSQFIRLVGSGIITLGINYRFKVLLTDVENGFRAIKTRVARELDLKENIATIEQEMVIKTLRKGYRIMEVPTHEYARKYGVSTIELRKVWFRFVYTWIKYLFF